MPKKIFEILVLTALTVGLIWTILELTPKSALLSLTILYQLALNGEHSFCQLMTASMPTFIGHNITGIRPTHDCFCANLGHIMTAFMPTLGLTA